MTRGDWWLGVTLVTLALLAHAAFPRYEWRPLSDSSAYWLRIDRWTGRAVLGQIIAAEWRQGPAPKP